MSEELFVPPSFEEQRKQSAVRDDMQYGGGECETPKGASSDEEPARRIIVGEDATGDDQLDSYDGGEKRYAPGYDIPPNPNCITAFVVVIDLDGVAKAFPDPGEAGELVPLRPAELTDLLRGCSEVVRDVELSRMAIAVTQNTVQTLMQQSAAMAQQMQQQREADAIASRLGGGLNPFGHRT